MHKRMLRKRLAVDLPHELHEHIQRIARKRNCSITTWVTQTLERMAQVETIMNMNLWEQHGKIKDMY